MPVRPLNNGNAMLIQGDQAQQSRNAMMTNRNSESFKSIHQQLEQHKQTPNKVLFSASNVLLPSNSRTSVESLNRNPAYSSA